MQLQKLALTLTMATLLIGCVSQFSREKKENISSTTTQPIIPISLKAAIEDLRVIKIKIEGEGGINPKEYGENLADLVQVVDKAYGNAKALAAVKSAVEGHKLALQFLQCDRVNGYNELYQCRNKVLKGVFVKYPDIAAQAKAAVEGKSLSNISAFLDKDAVLQAIWQKTGQDTEAALQVVNPPPKPKENPH